MRVGLLALGCVCVAMLGVSWQTFALQSSAAGRAPGGHFDDPVVRAVDIAEPSIVRLATIYTARITLTLCGQSVTLPSGGNGYTLGAMGSGAFISADGDILTADHVVNVPKELLDQAIFQEPQSAADIATLLSTNPGCHASQPISASDVAAGYVQYAGIPFTVHYSSPRRLVWQSTGYTGPVSNSTQDTALGALLSAPYQEATVVGASSVNDNDVAIVHVNLSDTPSIQLDNSATVAVEDQLTLIGYPGNGDVTNDGTDLLTPSVNVITVSASKAGENGEQLIQVGGNVEHGDSGGPALDSQGHIVGIVSFGFVTGDSPGSTAFLRASNSVRSLLTSADVNTASGAFERQWEAAFTDYAATGSGHWHKAAGEMDALSREYPAFHGIDAYKNYADQAASIETTTADALPMEEIAAGVLALLVLVIVVTILLLARGRKRKRQLAYAPAGQPLPYNTAYAYGNPAGYSPAAYAPASQRLGAFSPPGSYGPQATAYGPNSTGWAPYANDGNGFARSTTAAAMASTGASAPQTLDDSGYPGSAQEAPMGRMPSDLSYTVPAPPQDHAASQNGYAYPVPSGAYLPTHTVAGGNADGNRSESGYRAADGGPLDALVAAAQGEQGYCSNGHPMSAGEHYCAQCGAPRWSGHSTR